MKTFHSLHLYRLFSSSLFPSLLSYLPFSPSLSCLFSCLPLSSLSALQCSALFYLSLFFLPFFLLCPLIHTFLLQPVHHIFLFIHAYFSTPLISSITSSFSICTSSHHTYANQCEPHWGSARVRAYVRQEEGREFWNGKTREGRREKRRGRRNIIEGAQR